VNLEDVQYKVYLDKEVERTVKKSELEIPSESNQPSMAALIPDKKEVVKRKYRTACARWNTPIYQCL
jgi:hypothetical protein